MAIVAFLVPFAFVYNPALMAIGTPLSIVLSVGSAFLGVLFLSAGFSRFLFMKLDRIAQILLLVGGLGLLSHLILVNVISLAVCLFIAAYLFRKSKRKEAVAA